VPIPEVPIPAVDGAFLMNDETLEAFAIESRFPLRAGHGEIADPGFQILAGADPRPWFAGTQQPASPLTRSMATTVHFWDQLVRFGIYLGLGIVMAAEKSTAIRRQ
jgi:hypothetical protein